MTDGLHGVTVDSGVEVPVPADDETWVVGAIIFDGAGRVFAQKRSAERKLFPGMWDIVGGHVDGGESILAALAREVMEETGWRLVRVRGLVEKSTWTGDDGRGVRHEVDYVVEVDGDLARPALEWSKHSAYGWFGPEDLPRLKENVAPGDSCIHDLVAKALRERSDAARR